MVRVTILVNVHSSRTSLALQTSLPPAQHSSATASNGELLVVPSSISRGPLHALKKNCLNDPGTYLSSSSQNWRWASRTRRRRRKRSESFRSAHAQYCFVRRSSVARPDECAVRQTHDERSVGGNRNVHFCCHPPPLLPFGGVDLLPCMLLWRVDDGQPSSVVYAPPLGVILSMVLP